MKIKPFFSLLVVFALVSGLHGDPPRFSLKGTASGWFAFTDTDPVRIRFGLRYLPEISGELPVSEKFTLSGNVSLNTYSRFTASGDEEGGGISRIKPYRAWLRVSSPQFEARLGLQKINFGAAQLFRPLMWFDRIDPRDPLQITDGVYGILFRYYFLNNAAVWAWGLYGNDSPKGWESSPTEDKKPEFGGRIQVPFLKGEAGLSFHHRKADLSEGILPEIAFLDPSAPEKRIGVDGRWDVGIGIWTEAVLKYQDHPAHPFPYQKFLTVGADYTLPWGNGVPILGETFFIQYSPTLTGGGQDRAFSALSLAYPLGILDRISGIFYYDWDSRNVYSFLSWNRTYDRWQFFVMGYWNPRYVEIYGIQSGNNPFSGRGIQLMLIFNH